MQNLGAAIGLFLALTLIFCKIPPFLCLLAGAAFGGLLGGIGILGTVRVMADGCLAMLPSVACILASGILAGALVTTGSAEKLAAWVMARLGKRWAVPAIACAVLLLTACGVFVDIAVITAAPIALAIGKKSGLRPETVLLAMIGGGKAGNIISPNPNSIAAAKAFSLELTDVMAANLIPALCALGMTILLTSRIPRGSQQAASEASQNAPLPALAAAVSAPAAVALLLALRPLAGISMDPILVLPLGGAVCLLACRAWKDVGRAILFGLREVSGVALVLLATGCLAGVIQSSGIQHTLVHGLEELHIPARFLAPLSGILMGGAAASTTAGTAIAAQTFGPALTGAGISALASAAMIHAGATVLDSLPHGSFFHATAGCTGLTFRQRLALIPAEALIGLTATAVSMLRWL